MKFKEIIPSDYKRLLPFFKAQRYELCAYSLPSLLAWSTHLYQPQAAIVDDALLVGVEYAKSHEKRHLILPVGPGKEADPQALAQLAQAAGHNSYWFVPGDYIERHSRQATEQYFQIKPQAFLDDYIYAAADLAELAGDKYSAKRNLIRQFLRQYGPDSINISFLCPDDAAPCKDFLEEWCAERKCQYENDEELFCERVAAHNALDWQDKIGWKGLVLRLDGKVKAFAMASLLTPDMGVLNFEKALASIKGLYQFFDRQCARQLFPKVPFINKESDMGLEGLAKAKKSYQPVRMVNSFELVLHQ
jgi:hypothetical protein